MLGEVLAGYREVPATGSWVNVGAIHYHECRAWQHDIIIESVEIYSVDQSCGIEKCLS